MYWFEDFLGRTSILVSGLLLEVHNEEKEIPQKPLSPARKTA